MCSVNKRRIIKNTLFLYIKVIVNTVVLLYSTSLVLNALGAIDYGIYGIVGGVIGMLGYLNTAMAKTTQRFLSFAEGKQDRERQKVLFNTSIIVHFGIGVGVFLLMEAMYYPLFHGILNIPEERITAAQIIYHTMAVSTVFTILTVPYDATINAHEDLVYYSIVGVFEVLLKLAVAFIVVYTMTHKLILYGVLMTGISILMMIIMRIYCHHRYEECVFSPKKYYSHRSAIEVGKFAGWNLIGTFSSIAGNYGAGLLMNHIFGTVVIAAQTIANQVGGALSVFSSNMVKAINPVIVKSEGEGNRSNMLALSLVGCRYSFFLYTLFAIPFLLETEYILKLWLKNVPEWTVLFCRLQVLRTMLEQLTNTLDMALMAEGHIMKINIVNFVLSVFTLVVLYLLYSNGFLPYWHFIISIFFMVVLESCFKIYYCNRYCHLCVNHFLRDVFGRCILCAAIPFFVGICYVSEFNEQGFFRLCLTSVISTTTLIIMLFSIGISKQEKNMIIDYISIKLHRND